MLVHLIHNDVRLGMPTKTHTGALPNPVDVLERCFLTGGVSLVHAAFENTFFINPAVVRARTPHFPDRARLSRQHYPKRQRGDWAEWKGAKVRLGDNSRAQMAWAKYTGRPIARSSGYGVRHVWGNPWDPFAFTGGWNLAYMPYWAGMLTEEQHPHELLERAIRQAAWNLFFRGDPVCTPPAYVSDPGLDLDEVLGGRPLLILCREDHETVDEATPARAGNATAPYEIVRSIRRQTHQSWLNIRKAVLEIQGREHEPFGTSRVGSSSKSIVKRMMREAQVGLEELALLLDGAERGAEDE